MAEQNVTANVMCLMVNFKWPRNMGGALSSLSYLKRINGFFVMRHPNYHS